MPGAFKLVSKHTDEAAMFRLNTSKGSTEYKTVQRFNQNLSCLEDDIARGWTRPGHNLIKFIKLQSQIAKHPYHTKKHDERLAGILSALVPDSKAFIPAGLRDAICNMSTIPDPIFESLVDKKIASLKSDRVHGEGHYQPVIDFLEEAGSNGKLDKGKALKVAYQISDYNQDAHVNWNDYIAVCKQQPQASNLWRLYGEHFRYDFDSVRTISHIMPDEFKSVPQLSLRGNVYTGAAMGQFKMCPRVNIGGLREEIGIDNRSGSANWVLNDIERIYGRSPYLDAAQAFRGEARAALIDAKKRQDKQKAFLAIQDNGHNIATPNTPGFEQQGQAVTKPFYGNGKAQPGVKPDPAYC